MSTHKTPDDRREQILSAGLKLAAKHGYTHLTRKQVMDEAGQAPTMLSSYFGTMSDFRKALMRYAVAKENLAVIGQGLLLGDRIAKRASPELRARVAAKLV